MTRPVVHLVRGVVGALVGVAVVVDCWTSSFLDQDSHQWAIVAIIATAILVAECLPDLEIVLPWPGAVTIAMLFPLAAIYGCVPETDHLPTIGALLGVVALMEIVTRRPRRIIWHGFAATLVLWGGVYGATGRDRAFVGGLFAFWPIVVVAIIMRVLPRLARVAAAARAVVFVLGAVATLIVARTGALQTGRRAAARDAVLTGAASLVLALAVAWAATRARPSRPTS